MHITHSWVMWRHAVLYIYVRKYESGGLMWPFVFKIMLFIFCIFGIFVACVFAVKRAYIQVGYHFFVQFLRHFKCASVCFA